MKVNFVLLERPASPDDPFFLDGQIQLFVLEQIGIVELPLSFRALTFHNFPSVFLGDRGDVLGPSGFCILDHNLLLIHIYNAIIIYKEQAQKGLAKTLDALLVVM